MASQTAFYKTWVKIGGVYYPAMPNSLRFSFPKNYIIPPTIGNYWQWNYAEGLRVPMIEAQFMVQDVATGVLSSGFLNNFLTRSNDVAHDTGIIASGIEIFNGRRGQKISGVKADSFTIGCAKGEPLRFTARFVGSGVTVMSGGEVTTAATSFSAGGGWTKDCLMSFSNVAFAGALANEVWNFNLSYSNNHTPDLSLNGLVTPAAQNAGMMSAGMSFLTQAAVLPLSILPNNGLCPPPTTPDTIAFTIAGSTVTRTFTLINPINSDPDSISIPAGRVMQDYSVIGLGANGVTTGPLAIS